MQGSPILSPATYWWSIPSQVVEYVLHAKLHTNAHISPSPLQRRLLIQWQVVCYFQEPEEWQTCPRCYYKRKIIFTGTEGTDRLYHIDTPCWLKEFSYLVTKSPTIVELPVNCWKQDEFIEGLEIKNEGSTIGNLQVDPHTKRRLGKRMFNPLFKFTFIFLP